MKAKLFISSIERYVYFKKEHFIISISSPISTPLFHSLRIFYADNKCTLYTYDIYMYVYVCVYIYTIHIYMYMYYKYFLMCFISKCCLGEQLL